MKNVKTLMGLVLCLALWLSATPASSKPPAKDLFVKNPNYSDTAVPAKDQKLNLKSSHKRVDQAFGKLNEEIAGFCAENRNVFRVMPKKSALKVTSFKNWNIPVVGTFKNFAGYITWNRETGKPLAKLVVDNTSWDSGVADRDNRVRRFLLQSHKRKNAISVLTLEHRMQKGLDLAAGHLTLRGQDYVIGAPMKKERQGPNWLVHSTAPFRLKANIPERDMFRIMKLCNHQSLTPAVDLEFWLVFKPACP